jgi:hypothetical protein
VVLAPVLPALDRLDPPSNRRAFPELVNFSHVAKSTGMRPGWQGILEENIFAGRPVAY